MAKANQLIPRETCTPRFPDEINTPVSSGDAGGLADGLRRS
jgi:hypothetical protein